MVVLDQLNQYHGAGKANPVVLDVPAGPQRVAGVGLLVPLDPSMMPPDPARLAVGVWGGPRELVVIVGSERGAHGTLLHVSVSYPKRLPPWEVMSALRFHFFGDLVDVAMILPRSRDWVNLHQFCLHLQQIPVEWGIR